MILTEQQYKDIERTHQAPIGCTWVCRMCGRTAHNRDQMLDVSCYINSVLVETDSIIWQEDGERAAAVRNEVVFDPRMDKVRA